MKKTIIVLLAIMALLIVGCQQAAQHPVTTPSTAQSQTPAQTASPRTVEIEGFAFNPSTITVLAGDTVTWENLDSAPHKIKSGSVFESNVMNKGDTFQLRFDAKGTFDYACTIHPSMKGTVVVE